MKIGYPSIVSTKGPLLAAMLSLACLAWSPATEAAGAFIRQIPNGGVGVIQAANPGSDALQDPEFDTALSELGVADGLSPSATGAAGVSGAAASQSGGRLTNRSIARAKGKGEDEDDHERAMSDPKLALSFDGLNFRQQRLANGGNQFSVEPPDQGLCVGNGFVLEAVNSVLRVWDTSGNAMTGPVALNTFFGYAPAIIRGSPNKFGPNVIDPICYYDPDTQRWFVAIFTLDRKGTTSALSGKSHIDIAVSATASPLGGWNIYRTPSQNDGTDGTPVHSDCPCIPDYPHIGADANGIYISVNEFPLFVNGFNSAQIYAFSKKALAAGSSTVTVVLVDTINNLLDGTPGFTVWPATSPAGKYENDNRGTEYFVSSQAVFNDSGTDNRLRVWALTNTRSLNSATPDLRLIDNVVKVRQYGVPPPANQKPGDFPLGQCINDTTLATPFGPGCWQFLFVAEPPHAEVLTALDSNDSRIQQVVFADEKLWTALDTTVTVNGKEQAGIAYYVLKPDADDGKIKAKVKKQGMIAVANNNVTYPSVAVLPNGKGVMAFTLVGADHHPSAAYVSLDAESGAGPIHVAAEGVGPQDGFTGYKAEVGDPPRPRWGDYGAAVADGNSIWIASEYINQTCTLAQYTSGAFGSCGGTRATLGNWGTRISKVTP